MPMFKRLFFTLLLTAAVFVLVWFIWIKGEFLFATLLLLFGATALAGWIHSFPARPAVLPDPDLEDPTLPGPGWTALLGAAALGSAWVAFVFALAHDWLPMLAALFAGAAAWRFCLPAPLPRLPNWAWAALGSACVAVAALFRLYKAGAIPEGFVGVDESFLWLETRRYLNGFRSSYGKDDGVIPYYIQAFGLKAFGGGFRGWRMSGILIGTGLTAVMFQLGRHFAGRWAGVFAAALWAFAVWPVTISRAPYFMTESYLMVLVCMLLLLEGLRRGSAMLFAMAGLFWSFTFNVYPATRIMLLIVPWLLFLVWYQLPSRRALVSGSAPPLLAGFVIGLLPLVIWLFQNQPYNLRSYGAAFIQPHQVGNLSGMSPLAGLDNFVQRFIANFSVNFRIFTKGGDVNPYYFPYDYPLFHPAVLFLALAGFSVCLARFRNPLSAFLIYWWFAGLLPALVSAGGSVPTSRRDMLVLPPTLILAAVGLSSALGVAARLLAWRWLRLALASAFALAFLGWLGQASWHDYFVRNQNNYSLLAWTRVNGTRVWRAIYEENEKAPVAVVSTRRLNEDSWVLPGMNPYRGPEFPALNPDVPLRYTQEEPEYYEHEGLFGSLKWALQQRRPGKTPGALGEPYDLLVVLTPFHFYLQPLLERLGGQVIREIPLAVAKEGVLRGDASFGYDDKLVAKVLRMPGLKPEAIDALRAESLHKFSVEVLTPPDGMKPEAVKLMPVNTPEFRRLSQGYMDDPGRWRTTRSLSFTIPDPWFWTTHGHFPTLPESPLRIRAAFDLRIPAGGSYAFGASATHIATLRIDGRKVFQRDSNDPAARKDLPSGEFTRDPNLLDNEAERRGYLGAPVTLSAGSHRLEVEQAWLSINPSFGQILRVIWQAPGGRMETLPLEVLRPWNPGK